MLQRKAIDPLKVDVSESNRRDFIARNRLTRFTVSLQHLMQFPGVVGDDGIGEERKRAADHDFLVSARDRREWGRRE